MAKSKIGKYMSARWNEPKGGKGKPESKKSEKSEHKKSGRK